MNKIVFGRAAAALIFVVIAFVSGGIPLVSRGFISAGEKFITFSLILIVAFTVAGFTSILVPQKFVSRWLGKEAGWKGPFLGSPHLTKYFEAAK